MQGPIRATVDDYDQMVEVADTCFVQDKEQGGMQQRWPHCYIKNSDFIRNYLLMKDGDTIAAQLGYVDQAITIQGRRIRIAGITGVATRPEYRGQGLMTTLTKAANQQMQKQGYALAELGGLRSRYNHFGYENSPRELHFDIHAKLLGSLEPASDCEVLPYKGEESLAQETLVIHNREGFGFDRNLEKHKMLLGRRGWEAFVCRTEGKANAYVSLVRNTKRAMCQVYELAGTVQGVHAILNHQVTCCGTRDMAVTMPMDHPLNPWFFHVCTRWSVCSKRMIKILDLPAILEGFGEQMRQRYQLADYRMEQEFCLQIKETGQAAQVCLSCDKISVQSHVGARPIVLSELEMVRFLFGSAGPGNVVLPSRENGFLQSVLPLDFHVWTLEGV